MSREVRLVPLGFDWPIRKVWSGYQMPDELQAYPCPDCGGDGSSTYVRHLQDRWYGNVPFDPAEEGSTPYTADTPQVQASAERHVSHSAWFYGSGVDAVHREAERLANLWNGAWSHHLSQADVDALVEAGRLYDFTRRRWDSITRRWVVLDPAPMVTAEQVNLWSIGPGFGHDGINRRVVEQARAERDGINCRVVVNARAERDGQPCLCGTCEGGGYRWRDAAHKAAYEAWEPTPPPTGDGLQVWETTSEGSPISPVFTDQAALVDWCTTDPAIGFGGGGPLTREQAEAFAAAGSSVGSFVIVGGQAVDGSAAVAGEPGDPLDQPVNTDVGSPRAHGDVSYIDDTLEQWERNTTAARWRPTDQPAPAAASATSSPDFPPGA